MEISDLDFSKIYEESDNYSRGLYFNNSVFSYRQGVIFINGVHDSSLSGHYYYIKSNGDLCIRRNHNLSVEQISELGSVDLGCGVYFENTSGHVYFVNRRPSRSARKGLELGNLRQTGGFEDNDELYTFLIEVVTGERQPSAWFYCASGTYLYGHRLSEEELSLTQIEETIRNIEA